MRRLIHVPTLAACAIAAFLSACDDSKDDSNQDRGDSGVPSNEVTPRCTTKTAVPCTDQQIQQLALSTVASAREIRHESDDNGTFVEYVDARAGGLMPTESFVYAKFTPNGLERVDISDEQAFDSLDWQIAFRRYVIRVNSGIGGPSCTQVARVPSQDFPGLTQVPEGLTFRSEEYFTPDTCDLVNDGSGLPGAAAVALGSYWTYSMCVQMSHNVFVLRLADGHDVKFRVLSYYAPDKQMVCDDTGSVPMPSGAAELRVEWAYLP